MKVPKERNEWQEANLYDLIVTMLKERDPGIHDYLLESNICDDCGVEEIFSLLTSYYEEVRQMRFIAEEEEDFWVLELTNITE